MTFSDADMKRLKDWVSYARGKYNGKEMASIIREIDAENMEALLARLEMAEAISNGCDCDPHQHSLDCKGYQAWRKEAGK